MGGKAAKERRRLKRLLEAQRAGEGGPLVGAAAAAAAGDASKGDGGGDARRPAEADPRKGKNREGDGVGVGGDEREKKRRRRGRVGGEKRGFDFAEEEKGRIVPTTDRRGGGRSNRRKNGPVGGAGDEGDGRSSSESGTVGGGRRRPTKATPTPPLKKQKVKKPKHLKRKLAQLSNGEKDDDERAKLTEQMRLLKEKKAKRVKTFEAKIRKKVASAGKEFDEKSFREARENGASAKVLLEAARGSLKKEGGRNAAGDGNVRGSSRSKRTEGRERTASPTRERNDRREGNGTEEGRKEDVAGTVPPPNQQGSCSGEDADEEPSADGTNAAPPSGDEAAEDPKTPDAKGRKGKGPDAGDAASSTSDSAESDSSDGDDAGEVPEAKGPDVGDDASASSSDDDSDGDGGEISEMPKRRRGRGRKGLRDADARRAALDAEARGASSAETKAKEKDDNGGDNEGGVPTSEKKKTPKSEDRRRCIGRKPVTHYQVGKTYDGTVIYVKPFGAFVDVGCHSDAFCHVSRVKDGYVESAEDALKAGDEVSARIVEVDRKRKRLTVSLQSEARSEDERKSAEALMEQKKRREGKKRAADNAEGNGAATSNRPDASKVAPHSSNDTGEKETENHAAAVVPPREKDPSQMTPAELKRARKIARRAERRAQKEITGLSA